MIRSPYADGLEADFVAIDELGRVIPLGRVRYLNPADQVLDEMFTGWRRQQLARNLALATIDGRERLVRRPRSHDEGSPEVCRGRY